MIINERKISESERPYIIAELSANHGGSIDRAKKSIIAAANTGVSAVKIQSYTPDSMTIDSDKKDFCISSGLWADYKLYDLYKKAYTPFEWHEELFECAKNENVTIFSTPFDERAVDLLEELRVPAYKVASFEIIDIPLIKYIAKRKKPMLLSTGMASLIEIEEALKSIREVSDIDVLLFHCISSYPTPTNESHLANINFLKNKFGVEVGLSDHTISNLASVVSIGMGAVAIEKHFKLDEKECGPDSSFSLNIKQLSSLIDDCNNAWEAKGNTKFNRSNLEKDNLVFRRSIYFIKNLKKGQIIKTSDIRRIRPGYGLKPKYFNDVIGKTLTIDVERGDPVTWDVIN